MIPYGYILYSIIVWCQGNSNIEGQFASLSTRVNSARACCIEPTYPEIKPFSQSEIYIEYKTFHAKSDSVIFCTILGSFPISRIRFVFNAYHIIKDMTRKMILTIHNTGDVIMAIFPRNIISAKNISTKSIPQPTIRPMYCRLRIRHSGNTCRYNSENEYWVGL